MSAGGVVGSECQAQNMSCFMKEGYSMDRFGAPVHIHVNHRRIGQDINMRIPVQQAEMWRRSGSRMAGFDNNRSIALDVIVKKHVEKRGWCSRHVLRRPIEVFAGQGARQNSEGIFERND